jgi:hypothetical protein
VLVLPYLMPAYTCACHPRSPSHQPTHSCTKRQHEQPPRVSHCLAWIITLCHHHTGRWYRPVQLFGLRYCTLTHSFTRRYTHSRT